MCIGVDIVLLAEWQPPRTRTDRTQCPVVFSTVKALATSLSLGPGSSGGICSPSLFMGAMVGGGTGAVMTAVTMIFEMSRD